MGSSLLAAMDSAGDEGAGGDGTMNGEGLRASLSTGAGDPTSWGNRTIGRAPLETGVKRPTQWIDRIEPGANDQRTWRDRAMDSSGDESPGGDGTMNGEGLRAPLSTGAGDPTPWGNRTIGRDGVRAPLTENTEHPWLHSRLLCALEFSIWCLDVMLDVLQHIERRTRRERTVQSPV